MRIQHSISSPLYQSWLQLDPQNYEELIGWYERHLSVLGRLSRHEYFDIYYTYVVALWEAGLYTRFLHRVDWLIEQTIIQDIYGPDGEDLFAILLFKKCAALRNVGRTTESLDILEQLIRMKPENASYRLLLHRLYTTHYAEAIASLRIAGVLIILASSVLIAYELFYIRPIVPERIPTWEEIRNILFFSGLSLILGVELWYRLSAWRRTQKIIRSSQARRWSR